MVISLLNMIKSVSLSQNIRNNVKCIYQYLVHNVLYILSLN